MNTSNAAGNATPATDSSLIDSSHVEGTSVFDPDGKHIGSVKRLVIDKVSGRVVYTVAQFGGFMGIGANEYTIPWNKLTYDTGLSGYQTDITEDELRGAPAFGQNGSRDYGDRDRERELNDYYGSPYYWE